MQKKVKMPEVYQPPVSEVLDELTYEEVEELFERIYGKSPVNQIGCL